MKAAIKVIPIILIIAAFSAIFSINSFASNLSYNKVQISSFSLETNTYQWVTPSINVVNNNIEVSQYGTTGVNRQKLTVDFDNTILYSVSISFDIQLVNKTYNININANTNTNIYFNSWVNSNVIGSMSYNLVDNYTIHYNFEYDGQINNVKRFEILTNAIYLNDGIVYKNVVININKNEYSIASYVEDIKNDIDTIQKDVSDIKDAIIGTETVPINNSGEDNLLDKLDEETGVINDMIDEFRAFDISKYTGGIYAVMYMSTPWTNQEWFKAVMVVLLTLFALITVVRGLRR